MTRRRLRLIGGVVTLLLVLAYSGVIVHTSLKARDFRRHPSRQVAQKFFKSEWPHNLIARAILFKGSSCNSYWRALYEYVFTARRVAETPWNRWLLERHILKRMSAEDRIAYLPHYPLTPSDRLFPILRDILSVENDYRILPVLAKTPPGSKVCLEWARTQLANRSEEHPFTDIFPYLLTVPHAPIADWATACFLTGPDGQPFQEAVRLDLHPWFSPSLVRVNEANEFLDWIKNGVTQKQITMDSSLATFLGFLANYIETRERATRLLVDLVREEKEGQPADPAEREFTANDSAVQYFLWRTEDETLRLSLALEIFTSESLTHPETALDAFRGIVDVDIHVAEKQAKIVIQQADSTLRKGVIVILADHGSTLGIKHLDEAFRGAAPRRTYFVLVENYLYGCRATSDYEEISGHQYLASQKQFPPVSDEKTDYVAEVKRWPGFIKNYPWFPGTDDAYYRLAYSQFKTGDIKGTLQSIIDYRSREFPDIDAEPFIVQLLAQVIQADEDSASALFRNPEALRELHLMLP